MENYDRKKIIQILSKDVFVDKLANPIEALADYLIDNGVTFKTKEIITNFDRIKSMSVEEMAEWLEKRQLGFSPTTEDEKQDFNESVEKLKQWLLQEVSDNEH